VRPRQCFLNEKYVGLVKLKLSQGGQTCRDSASERISMRQLSFVESKAAALYTTVQKVTSVGLTMLLSGNNTPILSKAL
jgi:hypothetical protein